MQRLRWLFIWCLAALWLPMALHCAMDRAGLFAAAPGCCAGGEQKKTDAGCAERCDVLADGAQMVANDTIKAPASIVFARLPVAIELPHELLVLPGVSPDTADSPPELSPIWQFDRRAALPARAPTLLS